MADDIEGVRLASVCYAPIADQIPHRSELTRWAMNGRCLNCRTRAVADRHHRESWINSNYLPCTLAWKRLELMFGSWCLREGAIVLECNNAGQGLKLLGSRNS